MILEQYYIGCLSHASYLIGDERTGRAVVVDPRRDVDGYLEEAKRLGLTITGVADTHFHAYFVSGHLELQDAITLVDIRNPGEREFGTIAGALPIPLTQLHSRIDELPIDRPVIVTAPAGGDRVSPRRFYARPKPSQRPGRRLQRLARLVTRPTFQEKNHVLSPHLFDVLENHLGRLRPTRRQRHELGTHRPALHV